MLAFSFPPPLEEECLVLDILGDHFRGGRLPRGGVGDDLEVLDGFAQEEDGHDNILYRSRQPSGHLSTRLWARRLHAFHSCRALRMPHWRRVRLRTKGVKIIAQEVRQGRDLEIGGEIMPVAPSSLSQTQIKRNNTTRIQA